MIIVNKKRGGEDEVNLFLVILVRRELLGYFPIFAYWFDDSTLFSCISTNFQWRKFDTTQLDLYVVLSE